MSIMGEMEARKLPTRQDKDGNFIISFSVHPDDARAKPDLLTAAPGTPFAVKYCTIDYDNPAPSQAPVKRERKPKGPFHTLPPSEQAGLLCQDPEFWAFLVEKYGSGLWEITGESGAAHCVREKCFVTSRSELDSNINGRRTWNAILADWDIWRKQRRAAERARSQEQAYRKEG